MNPCPTSEQRRRALLALHGSLLDKHKVRFLATRHHWWEEQQRGALRGFIWSSELVLVQAYQAVSEDWVLSYRLTQDHDFAFYYRAVFRIIPIRDVPYDVVNELVSGEDTFFSDIVWSAVDMSKVNIAKPINKSEARSAGEPNVIPPELHLELATVGGGDLNDDRED